MFSVASTVGQAAGGGAILLCLYCAARVEDTFLKVLEKGKPPSKSATP